MAFRLGLIAQEQGPPVGLAGAAAETFAQQVVAVLGARDFEIASDEVRVYHYHGVISGVEGLVEAGGEEAGFEAGGTEESLLGEGDALEGEEFLGVDGLEDGQETSWRSSRRTTAKVEAVKPCLRAFWAERALPCGARGPVDLAALARLAASCSWETGCWGYGMRLSFRLKR